MAKLSILAGATSQSVNVFIQNSSVTTGAGLTGLVFNSSSLVAYYAFNGANGGSNAITLATLSTPTSAYSSGGFVEIDATNMPGLYRFDIPNAAIAGSKGRSSVIMFKGATNMAPCLLEIELTGWDNQVAYSSTTVGTVTTVTNQLTAAAIATGVWQDSTAGDFTTASSIGKSLYTGNVAPGGVNGLLIAGTNAATTFSSSGAALTITSTGGNGDGLVISGNGTGAGIKTTGGATGNGIKIIGGGTSGAGLAVTTTSGDGFSITPTAGHGITATGQGTTKHGINATGGATTSHGALFTGGGVGHGIKALSGSGATGDGINATSQATAGNGMTMAHNGSAVFDLNATTTPLTLAKTTNITGFNDIAATAIVSAGAITTSSGKVSGVILTDTVTTYTGNTVQTGDSYARLGAPVGASISADIAAVKSSVGSPMQAYTQPTGFLAATFPSGTVANTTNITAGTITTATNLTNAPTVGDFTAAMKTSLNAATPSVTVSDKTGFSLSSAGIQAIWDALTSALTTVGSIGKLLVTNLDAAISSRMATYTQPTGFLSATFPSGTIANTTNITAGTITTATNLTNAATAGDLTATMKTSVTTAATAATPTAAAVTGSVGSVIAAVGITSNRKKAATATFEFTMQDSTTGADQPGLTVASAISKDGGAFASTTNAVTEVANGWYQLVLTATEMTANNVALQMTATGATARDISIQTQP